jgi:hypothetical protein
MTTITLIKKDNNNSTVNTSQFNISTSDGRLSCARKMLNFVSEGYYTLAIVTGSNNRLEYNDVSYIGQVDNPGIITDIPLAIQTIARYLEREGHNRNIIYNKANNDNRHHRNRVMGNVNSHSYITGNIRQ